MQWITNLWSIANNKVENNFHIACFFLCPGVVFLCFTSPVRMTFCHSLSLIRDSLSVDFDATTKKTVYTQCDKTVYVVNVFFLLLFIVLSVEVSSWRSILLIHAHLLREYVSSLLINVWLYRFVTLSIFHRQRFGRTIVNSIIFHSISQQTLDNNVQANSYPYFSLCMRKLFAQFA